MIDRDYPRLEILVLDDESSDTPATEPQGTI